MMAVMFFAIVSQTYSISRRTADIVFSLLYILLNNAMVRSTEKEGSGLLGGVECQLPSQQRNTYLCLKAFTK